LARIGIFWQILALFGTKNCLTPPPGRFELLTHQGDSGFLVDLQISAMREINGNERRAVGRVF
jgi:hypothetical protein